MISFPLAATTGSGNWQGPGYGSMWRTSLAYRVSDFAGWLTGVSKTTGSFSSSATIRTGSIRSVSLVKMAATSNFWGSRHAPDAGPDLRRSLSLPFSKRTPRWALDRPCGGDWPKSRRGDQTSPNLVGLEVAEIWRNQWKSETFRNVQLESEKPCRSTVAT